MNFSKLLSLPFLTVFFILGASTSSAQEYPQRLVKIVVPYGAGGALDQTARILSEHFRKRLGQQFIVENKPGAQGVIGASYVAQSAPDGYTLGVISGDVLTLPLRVLPGATFDQVKDFSPIGRVASSALVLAVSPTLNAKTLKEVLNYAKANPEKVNAAYSSVGVQLQMTVLSQLTHTPLTLVPFGSTPQVATSIMSGAVQIGLFGPSMLPGIKAGKLVAVAVASPNHWALAPEIPTTYEQGVEFDAAFWVALVAPAGTDHKIVERLSKELGEAMKDPKVKESFRALGLDTVESSPAEMTKYMAKERGELAAAARASRL